MSQRTATDTNVISALWSGEASSAQCKAGLEDARNRGSVIISAPVYCELHAYPGVTPDLIHSFLYDTGVVSDLLIEEQVWREAASRFARYAIRRRRSGGRSPKRMLIDFVVGAHALLKADCLFTLDRGRYARDFPE